MPDRLSVRINGRIVSVDRGTTAAVAVLLAGYQVFRTSVSGEQRGPLCGMGICFECRATVNGQPDRRTCQLLVQEGMVIETAC